MIGASGVDKAGATALTCIAVERKLAHREHGAIYIGQTEVHFACFIFEDAQTGDLASEIGCVRFAIRMGDAKEDKKSRFNGADGAAFHGDAGLADALNHCAHEVHYLDKKNVCSYNLPTMASFRVAPDTSQKLSLLGDEMRFEPAGNQPTAEGTVSAPRGAAVDKPKPLPCISEVSTPYGKKPLLKAMVTTACERNCFYCPFRAGRSKTQRVTFAPDEMAATFDEMQRARVVDGLFLSSGIIQGSVSTQDKLIDTVEIVRRTYGYRGYVHLKIMPGAEREQLRRAMQLADRVSVNLEGPTEQRLAALAPKKDYWHELIQRLQWIAQIRAGEAVRASVVTQFVVGAVGDTDLELLQVSDHLYNQLGLKRTYFSSFSPVSQTPFADRLPASRQREHRLYQASFLLRDYGWNVEDMPFQADANLRTDVDPKLAWAQENLREAPVELNRASRHELLRVPGIGPKFADAILRARKGANLRELSHLRTLGLRDLDKVSPFILLDGHRPMQQLSLF